MKIYTEFNSATWLRLVKFTEVNISEFRLLNISYHRKIKIPMEIFFVYGIAMGTLLYKAGKCL